MTSTGQFGKPKAKGSDPSAMEDPEDQRLSNGSNTYQIGAEIGRGGYAIVYAAFNVNNGSSVAVKRFPLDKIDAESLSNIEAEIELMKNLNHPNIVQYIDTIRTKSYLHIVLEYMENGSLSNMIKKFGSFTESLTSIYITQVLRGLKYLHEQGVLHRDIKGANILTTKDGKVKLADFGVALRLGESQSDEQDVLGSPYWIAPEIIEMSAPTPACDIWSLGCIIIELLTGRPPYFDLVPMAALFRIVQDDYPPMPEGISQALRDFLLLCFKKDPMMRSSATKLIEHPWLHNSSSVATETIKSNLLTRSQSGVEFGDDDDNESQENSIVNTIKNHQQEEEATNTIKAASSDTDDFKEPGGMSAAHRKLANMKKLNNSSSNTPGAGADTSSSGAIRAVTSPKVSVSSKQSKKVLSGKRSSFKLDMKNLDLNSPVVRIRKINRGNSASGRTALSAASTDSAEMGTTNPSSSSSKKHALVPSLVLSKSSVENSDIFTSSGGDDDDDDDNELDPFSDEDEDEQARKIGQLNKLSSKSGSTSSKGMFSFSRKNSAVTLERSSAGGSSSGLEPDATDSTPLTINKGIARTGIDLGKYAEKDEDGDEDDDENWDDDNVASSSNTKVSFSNAPTPRKTSGGSASAFADSSDHIIKRGGLGESVKIGSSRSNKMQSLNASLRSNDSMETEEDWDEDIIEDEDLVWGLAPVPAAPSRPPVSPKVAGTGKVTTQLGFGGNSISSGVGTVQRLGSSKSLTSSGTITNKGTSITASGGSRLALSRFGSSSNVPQLLDTDVTDVFEEEAEQQPQQPRSKYSKQRSSKPASLNDYAEDMEDMDNFDDLLNSPVGRPVSSQFALAANSGSISPMGIAASPKPPQKKAGFIGKSMVGKALSSPRGLRNSPRDSPKGARNPKSGVIGLHNKMLFNKTYTAAGDISSNSGELDDDFFEESDAVFNPGKKLADTLRQRMKLNTKTTADEEHDEFINFQFDETDFQQNEQKDAHSRRTKDVIELMAKIRPETREYEVIGYCEQLMTMFQNYPEQRNLLIDTYGVMPIIEMFEARLSVAAPRGGNGRFGSGSKIVRPYVLRVINKIIEGSIRTQEQLSLMGLIPSVMSLFQKSYNMQEFASLAVNSRGGGGAGEGQDSSSSSNNNRFSVDSEESTPSRGGGIHTLESASFDNTNNNINSRNNSNKNLLSLIPEVNPVTLEAARFIHLISSTSSLTLQMLIGAGGLSVLTSMVSFGVGINALSCETPTSSAPYGNNTSNPSMLSGDGNNKDDFGCSTDTADADTFNHNASFTSASNTSSLTGVLKHPPTPLKSVASLYSSSMYDKFSSQDYGDELTPPSSRGGGGGGLERMGSTRRSIMIDHDPRRASGKFSMIPGLTASLDTNSASDNSIDVSLSTAISNAGVSPVTESTSENKSSSSNNNNNNNNKGASNNSASAAVMALSESVHGSDSDISNSYNIQTGFSESISQSEGLSSISAPANLNSPNAAALSEVIAQSAAAQNQQHREQQQQQHQATTLRGSSAHSLLIFQMGVDCVMSVFAVQSSRTRDFCRLFVKLGLLPHLSVAFQNMLPLYYSQLEADSLRMSASGNSLINHNGSMYFSSTSPTGPSMKQGNSSGTHQSQQQQPGTPVPDSESSQERKYTENIATLFFKFSRSDRVVVETMAHNQLGVISVIVSALNAPELRRGGALAGAVSSLTPHHHHHQQISVDSNANSTSTQVTPRLSEQNIQNHTAFSIDAISSDSGSSNKWEPSFNVPQPSLSLVPPKIRLTPAYIEIIELLLKTLKNMSMEPSALPDLENAKTIEALIPLLTGPIGDRAKNHVLPFMFNMVRISRVSKTRQDTAAKLGIVPILKKVITDGSHLRQFALQILFDLAHSSSVTREELWKNDCVSFFLGLLKDNYWQKVSVNSLATWMHYESVKVEKKLIEAVNFKKFVDFFSLTSADVFNELHKPWMDMMIKSKMLSTSLSRSDQFIQATLSKLQTVKEAIVLKSLLSILHKMHQVHSSPGEFVRKYALLDVVNEFARAERQILVSRIANTLRKEFEESLLLVDQQQSSSSSNSNNNKVTVSA